MFYRTSFLFVLFMATAGSALAAGCSDMDRALQELDSWNKDLAKRVEALKASHQQLKDAELCQIVTGLTQTIAHIRACLPSGDPLNGKLEKVETGATTLSGQACKAP